MADAVIGIAVHAPAGTPQPASGTVVGLTKFYFFGLILAIAAGLFVFYQFSQNDTNPFRIEFEINKQYQTVPEVCSTLGYTKEFTVSEKHRQLHSIHSHTFQFPPPRDNSFLCVPSKNGNKNWGGLFFRLWYGETPESGRQVTDIMGKFSVYEYDQNLDRMWMVTRSPYVRLLSIYIEKIKCGPAGCHHQYLEGFERFRHRGNITFEQFVEVLYDDVVKKRDPARVQPIQRTAELCHIDHHLCPQAACLFKLQNNRVRILKLEEQGKWFRDFTKCFGIGVEEVVGKDWIPFSGQPCFYTPNGDCTDALQVDKSAHLISDKVHGKGAVDKLLEYYTPRAAEMATYLYQYDLDMLDQPIWDGKP